MIVKVKVQVMNIPKIKIKDDKEEEKKTPSKEEIKFKVIEFMNEHGYFKATVEYEKTIHFLKSGIVPSWLQKDIDKYYLMMNEKRIETGGVNV